MLWKQVGVGISLLILSAVTASAQAGSIPAASFNCARASGRDAQIICSNAELRDADALLATFFTAALAGNPDGKTALHLDERSWIATRDALCGVNRTSNIRDASGQVQKDYVSCFKTLYHARILYLQALTEPTSSFEARKSGVMEIVTGPGNNITFNFIPRAPSPSVTGTGETTAEMRQAQSELLVIVTRIRALYPAKAGFNLPGHTDITCDLANKGVFPTVMTRGQPCVNGQRNTYPASPWGSPVTIYAHWADNFDSGDDMFQVDFQLYRTIPNPCSGLIGFSLRTRQDNGLVRVWTASGQALDPQVPLAAPLACADAGFDFRL